jgi:hypothetical protein
MVNFNQKLEELLGDFASPIRQAQPALELNRVWAGCLVTPLAENGKKIFQLNASVTIDVGATSHLGGGDCYPIRRENFTAIALNDYFAIPRICCKHKGFIKFRFYGPIGPSP